MLRLRLLFLLLFRRGRRLFAANASAATIGIASSATTIGIASNSDAATTTIGIAGAVMAVEYSQSRTVKGRSRGLSLAKPVLVVVFLPHIIIERIPVVAGANGGHRWRDSIQ